jgi:hypothetical protein
LLLPLIEAIFFWCGDFQSAEKKSAKIKCLLFRPKSQKFHTAEITGYTVYGCQDTFFFFLIFAVMGEIYKYKPFIGKYKYISM